MFAIGRLSFFMDCYTPNHWSAAVHVICYLKGTCTLGLTLGGTNLIHLVGFSDSDYTNCAETSHSISSYCFSLGSAAISWMSKKQCGVADSSCYTEYITFHDSSHEVAFLRELLSGLHFGTPHPTPLHCDNDAARRLAEDHVGHPNVKHIRVKFHHIRELVDDGSVSLLRIRSVDNTADILTKPLARSDFLRLRHYLGIRATA